ncbi:MAG: GntR family transcriptional regulator [Alphaproteobacteria bacterium]|nr:GntR family transcriptional regulator [Alphaproteobacteria bacterium]
MDAENAGRADQVETNSGTAIDTIYRELRRRIIDGIYLPEQKLKIEHLRAGFQVSSSTVREALTRLTSDHLVTAEEHRGFRVTPMSMADLEDLTQARIVLECAVLRDSINNATEDWELRLVGAYQRLTRAETKLLHDGASFDTWEECNRVFHDALAANAHSVWLKRLRQLLFQQSERYRRLSSTVATSRAEVHAEHMAIFEAAIAHDAERATALLHDHVWRAANVIRDNTALRKALDKGPERRGSSK